ncbi:retrovirus-related pol polyprotein from transposon TNT 1-94 [Tanacetum coccineum]|uniref:Retrovirus-related pol polyprotein from transposon TNT 1-94 n=1 Tax=Tanacetum coccineum TaxID=301880 RepID=A0ABQ4X6S7_9ASTR
MANLSEDIKCVGSDTRPPMLDRTDFASWQQRIRLYCQGKENELNILKSIDEGPFQMGTTRDTLAEGTEVQDGRVVVQNVQDRQNRGQWNNARGACASGYSGAQNRVGNANPGQARQIKCYNFNGIGHIARNCTQPKRPQNSEYFKDKMLLMQAQENGVALDEEQLLFLIGGQDNAVDENVDEQPMHDLALNVDNVFQADDCDAFDSDVDEAPTAQTMFMENLSSADPVYDEASPSYDSDILSEYVKDNAVPVVQSNVSSVPNDAYTMLLNDVYEPSAQFELYERRAKFELTEREQKINEQLRIVIADRNCKEERLKRELHSIKLQLTSTINHNKSMLEEVTSLKKDFKQKENKYLEEFLNMKALKEKVEDKLYKQDQSLQTVHMLCKPKPYYDEQNKVAIGYKNPLCLTHARNKRNDKMKDPECVKKKVKIAPHDYSKDNYLATFTPQKQLTPEQIFWSNDLIKMKAEALKEQTTASRPIKALTMKHDEIEQKNLLIANDNLIADCLSKEVFYIATNSELTTRSEADRTLDFRTLDFQITQLNEKVIVLQEQNELSRAENEKVKQHSKELSQARSTTKKNRISPAKSVNKKKVEEQPRTNKSSYRTMTRVDSSISSKSVNKKKVEEHPRTNKSSLRTTTRVDSSISSKRTVVQIVLWYLDSGCSKHMTEDRSRLRNFVKKFIRTVRFRNDHFGAIIGYGDDVIGESVIYRVYYVEGLGHNLFSVRQFCDSDLEVAFRKNSCYVRDTDGVELIKGSRSSNLYTISIVPRAPQQNDIVERWNCTLVKAARTMIIVSKAPMFLWAEAVATTCYTQNQSLIHTHHIKTSYELVHDKKPDLTFFRVFGALCYLTNDSKDLGNLQPTADIGIFVGYAPSHKVAAQEPVASTGTPSSTTIDQDAPLISTSQTTQES